MKSNCSVDGTDLMNTFRSALPCCLTRAIYEQNIHSYQSVFSPVRFRWVVAALPAQSTL
jgi:hypothetical protein